MGRTEPLVLHKVEFTELSKKVFLLRETQGVHQELENTNVRKVHRPVNTLCHVTMAALMHICDNIQTLSVFLMHYTKSTQHPEPSNPRS